MDQMLKNYIDTIAPRIAEVEEKASVIMPDNPHELIDYITDLRGYAVFLNKIHNELQLLYRQAEFSYKPIKTKEMTEFDREILLKSLVSDYEMWKDRVEGLIDIIEGHSSMAQSIIAFEKAAMGHLNS